MRVDVNPCDDDGERIAPAVFVPDLTREREKVEQMKTELLSRVGHELRTPLTGIMGYADILVRGEVAAEHARSWHEEILRAARHLLRIVEMLEFLASSAGGRVHLRLEPTDIQALVQGITSTWSDRLPPEMTIVHDANPRTPPVLADRRWLGLAIEELIDNAVKFSPDGGGVVVYTAPAGSDGNSQPTNVQISVVDSGMGVTGSENTALFGAFVQGDESDTRRFGGLGLGLAVAQRVVEGHGGTVECQPALGRGTAFTIRLPIPVDLPIEARSGALALTTSCDPPGAGSALEVIGA